MEVCRTIDELVEERVDRVLTQYRESPNLLHLLRNYLGQVADVAVKLCDLPSFFDIETAVGDQLTLLGQRLGWPRCHCVCSTQPVFGFGCKSITFGSTSVGFCEATSTWIQCGIEGATDICLTDDTLYRAFLKVRRYQMLSLYDMESLTTCIQTLWGPTARILHTGQLRIVIAPGRFLTTFENEALQLYARVLPVAPGVQIRFHFGELRVFGFGEGWGGFAEEALDKTKQTDAYSRVEKVFGFCDDEEVTIGGFCEMWEPEGLPIIVGELNGVTQFLLTENKDPILTGSLTANSAWMCREDAPWMCEINVQLYGC